ncbi:sulfite exporter TauE/SafE family protein [Desulfobaculum sp. SPO524]|uniref:sulfite exporter TauE/SafE family protein n=1 Tax=Desulfobaculum sp. SPO524 TaxID=3378071 RepID=UPI0038551E9C
MLSSTLIVALVVFIGAFTQGLAGFGFAFFSLPIISLVLDFQTSVVILVLMAQVMNLLILKQHGSLPQWGDVLPLTVATLPGIPVGVAMLQYLPVYVLQGTLGIILVLYCLYMWFVCPVPRVLGKAWIVVAGFIAGCLGGALNSQGPPVLMYVALQPWDKDRVKATTISFFIASGVLVIAAQAWRGLITADALELSALCLPGVLLGATCGRIAYRRLGEGGFRTVFIGLLFALGLFMLVKSAGDVI